MSNKNKNIYSTLTKAYCDNFDNIFFPNQSERQHEKHLNIPKPLNKNIIEIIRCENEYDVYLHLWYKCIFWARYESKQAATNAAERLQNDYLKDFNIIIQDSFF